MIGAGVEGQLSVAEARAMFTLFAAVKSPLLLGSDPSRMGPEYLAIVKNAEIIQINQDRLGVAAFAVTASRARVRSGHRESNRESNREANRQALPPASCPATPPPHHACCDHPNCRERNASECGVMSGCCYHGTAARGQCWLNNPPPPPPPPPGPSPQPDPDPGGLIAFCQWGAGAVTAAQQWTVDADGHVRQGAVCLERPADDVAAAAPGGADLMLAACSPGKPTQLFITLRVNETLAQIRVPAPTVSTTGAGRATATGGGASCVGTDGRRAVLVPCAVEDPRCARERCAHSVLSNQLWYLSSTTRQLMSSFTAADIPPLAGQNGAAQTPAPVRLGRWGPDNSTLVNIPLCMASVPSARPERIRQPPAVLPTAAPWPAQQVWAGPLINNSFVVVFWNLAEQAATMSASWAELGVPAGSSCTVRDMWAHRTLPEAATGTVGAQVPSHDVVALRLGCGGP